MTIKPNPRKALTREWLDHASLAINLLEAHVQHRIDEPGCDFHTLEIEAVDPNLEPVILLDSLTYFRDIANLYIEKGIAAFVERDSDGSH